MLLTIASKEPIQSTTRLLLIRISMILSMILVAIVPLKNLPKYDCLQETVKMELYGTPLKAAMYILFFSKDFTMK